MSFQMFLKKSLAERHRKYWPSFIKLAREGLNQSWPRKLKLDKLEPVNCQSFVHLGCLKRPWHSRYIVLSYLTEVTVVLTPNQPSKICNLSVSLYWLGCVGRTHLFTEDLQWTWEFQVTLVVEQEAAPPTKTHKLQAPTGAALLWNWSFFSQHLTSETACCIISSSAARMMLLC